ncbi:MAG: zinc-ribbon domain containing protein [Dehalococcoidales bacterium]|jgi:CxxC-x17-CxxC domain-containing protein|nr:zinc-ribbon domain containing protein [Dehalococcoidales bacterium]
MAFEEKTLQCSDCGKSFPFTVEEQEFFASRGYTNEPKRCLVCRQSRRSERFGNSGGSRQMYPATCAQCGQETQVPFQPRGDKPVYCRECYMKNK